MIVLSFILPNYFGIKSMLVASGISSIVLVMLNLYKLNRQIGIKTHLIKTIIYHSIICIPVVILNKFCFNIFVSCVSTFFAIAFTSVISVLSYLGLLFVFGILDINIIKDYLLHKFKSKTNSNCQ